MRRRNLSSFSDDHLQRFAYLAANKGWPVTIECREEFARRGLEPAHAWYKTKCSICDDVALYRVGSAVYCRLHHDRAVLLRAVFNRQRDHQIGAVFEQARRTAERQTVRREHARKLGLRRKRKA